MTRRTAPPSSRWFAAARWMPIGRTADDTWLKVTTADGKTGWTPAARLVVFAVENLPALSETQTKPAAVASRVAITPSTQITGTVTTVGELLNLRAGPGTDYAIIGSRSPGQTLSLAGRNKSADWLAVALPDGKDIGWVSSSFVRAAGDPARLPITDRVSAASSVAAPPAAALSGGQQSPAATGLTGKLVFQAEGGHIQVYDLASGNVRSLTTGADPALSPDGQTVAFWRQDGGEHGLYVIDVNGGKETARAHASGEAAHPHLESRWPLHRVQPCQRRGDLPRRRIWGLFAGCLPIQSDVPGNPHRPMESRSSRSRRRQLPRRARDVRGNVAGLGDSAACCTRPAASNRLRITAKPTPTSRSSRRAAIGIPPGSRAATGSPSRAWKRTIGRSSAPTTTAAIPRL